MKPGIATFVTRNDEHDPWGVGFRLDGQPYTENRYVTPAEARQLAQKLLDAATSAERAVYETPRRALKSSGQRSAPKARFARWAQVSFLAWAGVL